MAAGLPIFFSGAGEGAQIIEKHQIGWTNAPDNFGQLASNIAHFNNGANERLLRSKKSRAAAQYFSRATQIELLDHFLAEHLSA